jgi:hypothetical protein
MAEPDKELVAIGSIIDLLLPLDQEQRGRVLEYVLKRLDMATVRAPSSVPQEVVSSSVTSPGSVVDIRTLTVEKQPRSAIEMAAVIGYYISELAPASERSDTINADTIRRYFKMAGFPMPSALRNVLPTAASAGYFESVDRGAYRLNPVGYNLVVHKLPRSGSPGPTTPSTKKRTSGRRGR